MQYKRHNTFLILRNQYYATFSPHLGIGGGVGVDLEEEDTFSLLIFWFDDEDVKSLFLLFDVWLLDDTGCPWEAPFPFLALASAAFSLTHVSPSAFAKWSSTVKYNISVHCSFTLIINIKSIKDSIE